MEKTTVEIVFDDVEMTVSGYFYKGYAGDDVNPPESKDFDVQGVWIEEQDVTNLLSESFNYVKPNYRTWELRSKLDEIADLILDQYI